MSKVTTFSRYFPAFHSRKGEPTYFVEQILKQQGISYYRNESYLELLYNLNCDRIINGNLKESDLVLFQDSLVRKSFKTVKNHTIRAGCRFEPGEYFSPRVWSGIPFNAPQIAFAPDIEVKKTWDFSVQHVRNEYSGKKSYQPFIGIVQLNVDYINTVAMNDGLSVHDFVDWFDIDYNGNPPKKNRTIFDGTIICWSDSVYYFDPKPKK